MAKPITKIEQPTLTEKEMQQRSLEKVIKDVADNAEGIQQTIQLLQELHNSGVLEAVKALFEAKEKITKIAVGQLLNPPVTRAINNVMAAAEALTELDPEMTKKLTGSVVKGLKKAEEDIENNTQVGILDLLKALRDPDINRAMGFSLRFLKGMGEGLKD
ncbi:hypothetical protein GCM10011571_11830 [Marinithermofilum abyssi]|uniref:DUF1641 domain-containing protein n=1 Tax=Marinithermofilum abyssi TaxID=1571185 RepID=A0A8J2YC60_9BACL|nr:DUF1641 domain-containing protein [Marinithermofilum abyssi]GGE12105.1 hypothetical protein GCM10011571_11830 [Marinithermofilum abyssi]